ncbi:hypothetical protein [Pedobacter metabolipauper]|uniref:Prepilin-type N-terminal cleavage/methylation domain-containing protein n=1 Tax=Pedobacter metabolipauper TaxID=425513 RepID=A0A4R6T0K9_9SPHI|nr:hypothetical protein [Pedobacter metabolipauper]TDQ11569.1 hypothetical protein ATK78_0692 [Pedobacter metabolipauper]
MQLNKKIPAFTIMEVTISMLIAGICIGITFTAYQIISGTYRNFDKKQEKIALFTTVDKLLKQDFVNARNILKADDGLAFQMEQGTISYSFNKDYVVRDQFALHADTFKLQINAPVFLFEGQSPDNGTSVDQFNFTTLVDGILIPLQYHKSYSAQDLFN